MCACIEFSSSPIWTSLYVTNPLHNLDIQFQHISSLQCNFHFIEDYGYYKSEGITSQFTLAQPYTPKININAIM
jgi:hypothetical protein